MVVITLPLVYGILFPTFPIFVLIKAAVPKPLTPGIFLPTFPIFSQNFIYLCCIDLSEIKLLHQEFFCLNYLLLYLF